MLPTSLEELEFESGSHFNHPLVPGMFGNKIKKLIFGAKFNHPINPNVIPYSITVISFGSDFNHKNDVDTNIVKAIGPHVVVHYPVYMDC